MNLFVDTLTVHEHAFGANFYLFGNDIYVVTLPKYDIVTRAIVDYGYNFLERHQVEYHNCIFILSSFTDIALEVRNWAADHGHLRFTLSDAIVLKDSGQQIISDFYIKQVKPSWPTKVFFNLKEAINWTQEYRTGN